MTKWFSDRKQKVQAKPRAPETASRPANDMMAYISRQREKLTKRGDRSTLELRRDRAREHLATLTGRHQFRERVATQRILDDAIARLDECNAGPCRELVDFNETVQPYIEAVQTAPRPGKRARNDLSRAYTVHDEFMNEVVGTAARVVTVDSDTCDQCDEAMVVMASGASIGCPSCSRTREYVQATSSHIPYGEEVEFSNFSYKRYNHFQEWLNSTQAKENTEVPAHVIERVMEHMYSVMRIHSVDQVTQQTVRKALGALELRKQYEHCMQIFVSITGKKPPQFTPFQETQLRIMFDAIQEPFKKHCPPERKNFLSYAYCLHKFCQIMGYDTFLPYFTLLKGEEKLKKQDAIFKNICAELDWEFIPSCNEAEAPACSTLELFMTGT